MKVCIRKVLTLPVAGVLLAHFCFAGVAGVDSEIDSLTLGDGRIISHVRFVSLSPSTTMAKWEGGRGTIPYSDIPEPIRGALIAIRPEQAPTGRVIAQPVRVAATVAKLDKPTQAALMPIAGQVFVTTQGAGSYKFGGVPVAIYRKYDVEAARSMLEANYPMSYRLLAGNERGRALRDAWVKSLAGFTPVATVTTEADGNFAAEIPGDGEFVAFASADRYVGRRYLGRDLGGEDIRESNLWIVPITGKRVDLNGTNCETN